MILQGEISISGKKYTKGSYISPRKVYPFFLFHMALFGFSGFSMAYFKETPVIFLYAHGGFALFVYLAFYKTIFGIDEVKWMLVNASLGIFGLYSEIDILLSWSGKNINSFPLHVHVIPFLYYVLYTFLIRQVFIEATGGRGDKAKSDKASYFYLLASLIFYTAIYLIGKA